MKFEFQESYSKLSDMKFGDVAISKDRQTIYICSRLDVGGKDVGDQPRVVLIFKESWWSSVKHLTDDMDDPVMILNSGDKFTFTV